MPNKSKEPNGSTSHDKPKGRSALPGLSWTAVLLLIVVGGYNLARSSNRQTVQTPPSIANSSAPGTGETPTLPVDGAGSWSYSEDTDSMRGTTTKYARVDSDDEQSFSFPYHGGKAELTIRKNQKSGADAYIEISGQFLCNDYNAQTIAVKFDDRPIQHFECAQPADGRTGTLFLRNASKFIMSLKHAKKLTIEAQFYQEGHHQMNWTVGNLSWK